MRLAGRPSPGTPCIGSEIKERARKIGPWLAYISGFGEMLPDPDNRVTLHETRLDQRGIPLLHIDCALGPNEHQMAREILADGKAML